MVAELVLGVDPFMLHAHAAVAEQEREMIDTRTKADLAELEASHMRTARGGRMVGRAGIPHS